MKRLQRLFDYVFTRVMLFVWIFLASVNTAFIFTGFGFTLYKNPENRQFTLWIFFWIAIVMSCWSVLASIFMSKEHIAIISSGAKRVNPISLYFYWLPYGIILIAKRISCLILKRT